MLDTRLQWLYFEGDLFIALYFRPHYKHTCARVVSAALLNQSSVCTLRCSLLYYAGMCSIVAWNHRITHYQQWRPRRLCPRHLVSCYLIFKLFRSGRGRSQGARFWSLYGPQNLSYVSLVYSDGLSELLWDYSFHLFHVNLFYSFLLKILVIGLFLRWLNFFKKLFCWKIEAMIELFSEKSTFWSIDFYFRGTFLLKIQVME